MSPAELQEASEIFESIALANAARSKQPAKMAERTEDRVRAYSLVLDAYSQIRRAITYLRWDEDDVDDFAPSLWAGRGGRGTATATAAPPAGGNTGTSAGAGATTTPAPTPVVPAAATGTTAPSAAVAGGAHAAPGMPDGSPFTNN